MRAAEDAVSLQYYPHHDLELKPPARSERTASGAGDYVAVAIIDAILAMALASFISSGGVVGTLVVLGLIAGFNVLALSGRG